MQIARGPIHDVQASLRVMVALPQFHVKPALPVIPANAGRCSSQSWLSGFAALSVTILLAGLPAA